MRSSAPADGLRLTVLLYPIHAAGYRRALVVALSNLWADCILRYQTRGRAATHHRRSAGLRPHVHIITGNGGGIQTRVCQRSQREGRFKPERLRT
jgi:hypothetical protein